MRLPILSLTLLLAASAPGAAFAQSELPRHRPRVTEEAEDDDYGYSGEKKRKKRKHANRLDEDEALADPPPRERYRANDSSYADDAELPPPRRERVTVPEDEAYEAAPPRKAARPARAREERGDDSYEVRESRRSRDDDADLRDESERRSRRPSRTAEEEIGEYEEWEDESLYSLDEPGIGMTAGIILGPAFLHSPLPGVSTKFGFGLDLSLQLGRYLFAPEWDFLHRNFILELAWLMAGANSDSGTDEIRVGAGRGVHVLSLALLFGYPLSDFLIYAKIGPLLGIMNVKYDVQGEVNNFTGVKGGVVYGGGVRASIYTTDAVGIAARIEVLGYRRGYLNDVMLAFGAGVAF